MMYVICHLVESLMVVYLAPVHWNSDKSECYFERICVRKNIFGIMSINLFNLQMLIHWGRGKMAAIYQTAFSDEFSWMKMYKFRLRFHLRLFPRVKLTIFQVVSLVTHICVTRPQRVDMQYFPFVGYNRLIKTTSAQGRYSWSLGVQCTHSNMCGEFNYESKYAKGTQLLIYVTFSSQYMTLKVDKLCVLLWLKDKYLWLG